MQRTLIFALFVFLFIAACKPKQVNTDLTPPNSTTADTAQLSSELDGIRIQTQVFTEIDSSGILIYPLSIHGSKDERYDSSSKSKKDLTMGADWNLIFYNTNDGSQHLLTEDKILIFDYSYKHQDRVNNELSMKTNHLFYTACSDDFNNDQKLDEKDPIYLYASDKSGENFRLLSPKNHSLRSWHYIEHSRKIMMSVIKDSNNDKLFDHKDDIVTFEIPLDSLEQPYEVFNSNFKNKLKTLYQRDWKIKSENN